MFPGKHDLVSAEATATTFQAQALTWPKMACCTGAVIKNGQGLIYSLGIIPVDNKSQMNGVLSSIADNTGFHGNDGNTSTYHIYACRQKWFYQSPEQGAPLRAMIMGQVINLRQAAEMKLQKGD